MRNKKHADSHPNTNERTASGREYRIISFSHPGFPEEKWAEFITLAGEELPSLQDLFNAAITVSPGTPWKEFEIEAMKGVDELRQTTVVRRKASRRDSQNPITQRPAPPVPQGGWDDD